MRIDPSQSALKSLAQSPIAEATSSKDDFGKMLMDALQEVNKTQADARGLQNDLMANRPVEYHDLMIAMERASTAMSLTLAVRNKVLEAYQEISRMQV
ncbi:MAG: flagellar hook-basal body complex protein FliE [Fimbriimonadaceae bacterium]|nr:flagellar hook-basal body complex protein FliE [Fimbriimonadaceae bacterium]QYK59188.1 MAG: flagellar hook-basal body complex protein FliE [Fimbriimonadaceae bacterium]